MRQQLEIGLRWQGYAAVASMAFIFIVPLPDVLLAIAGVYAILGLLIPASIIADNKRTKRLASSALTSPMRSLCLGCGSKHYAFVCPQCGSKARKIIDFDNLLSDEEKRISAA